MRAVRVPLIPSVVRWIAVFVVAGFIFYTSIITTPPPNPVVPKPGPPDLIQLDKWRHFLAYGALAGSLWYATVDWDRPTRFVVVVVLGTTIIYGIGLEYWQSLIPKRYFSVDDAYANAFGSLFSIPLLILRDRLKLRRFPREWLQASSDSEKSP
jgi:VanZ family protein